MKETYQDLVVIGSGVAGMAAAVAAAENGAKVTVLERSTEEERGGQSRYTEAYLRMKSEMEVSDDFEVHLAENGFGTIDPTLVEESAQSPDQRSSLVNGLSIADPEVIMTLSEEAGGTIAWLKGLGVRFDFLPTGFLTSTQPRLLPVGGGEALVEALAKRAIELSVNFLYETPAQKLLYNENGQIAGVLAHTKGHEPCRLYGKVVLACGGFQGNPEMMARYLGPQSRYLRPVCRGGYYNQGDGIRMGLEAGAATAGDFGDFHAEPIDPRSGISEPAIFNLPYGILVNKQGQRFVNEGAGTVDQTYEAISRNIYKQEGGIAYLILDAKHTDIPNFKVGIMTDQPAIAANSIEELAEKIEVPLSNLRATVQGFNASCQEGEYKPLELDGLSTQDLLPPKSNWAVPIENGPFHAYPVISANVFTYGGLKTDSDGRVLSRDGHAIPNLYSAGEMTGMYYGMYTGGTSVLRGLVFGKRAGAHAASLSVPA